jgi:hypothetical protein
VKCPCTNPQGKPVFDERTFQELLLAAYLLQQHNDRLLANSPRTAYTQVFSNGTVAEYVEAPSATPLTPETMAHPVLAAHRAYGYRTSSKRFVLTDELFWKTATFVAVAAASTLLLGAVHRSSPLPTSLTSGTEVVEQQTPFQKARPIVTVPTETGAFGAKTMTDEQPTSRVDPDSAQRTIVKPDFPRSAKRSEANIVAEDTVVRYGPRSATPRLQAQKNLPRSANHREADIVAEDTVVHYGPRFTTPSR